MIYCKVLGLFASVLANTHVTVGIWSLPSLGLLVICIDRLVRNAMLKIECFYS